MTSCGLVRSLDILNPLQKTYGHQTKQNGDLPWDSPTIKVTWLFDLLTNVRSYDKLKKSYLHFHTTDDHEICQVADFKEEVHNTNAKVTTNFFGLSVYLGSCKKFLCVSRQLLL